MTSMHVELRLAVVGAGYVGLVTAACLARMGHFVTCVDRDRARTNDLRRGVVPFREPTLDESVASGLASGRLTFSDDLTAIRSAEGVMVAVGTLDEHGEWTARHVEDAVFAIARDTLAPRLIIIRSTVMPGTSKRLASAAEMIDGTVEVAFNPEFTREGSAVNDFFTPDRIVIGTTGPPESSEAAALLRRAYAALNAQLLMTDTSSAELIKIGANAFLGLKVGFANELARLSATADIDLGAVIDGVGLDKRIGRSFMSPGPGYGGSCLPPQTRALPALAHDLGVTTPILSAIAASNTIHTEWVVECLERELAGLGGRHVTLLGLAFKAGTDDVRSSPSLRIARLLHDRGALLTVHDPLALSAGVAALAEAGIAAAAAPDLTTAFAGADAVIVATEWPAYQTIDWHAASAAMAGDLVFDTRDVVDVGAAAESGLRVVLHGRRADVIHTGLAGHALLDRR